MTSFPLGISGLLGSARVQRRDQQAQRSAAALERCSWRPTRLSVSGSSPTSLRVPRRVVCGRTFSDARWRSKTRDARSARAPRLANGAQKDEPASGLAKNKEQLRRGLKLDSVFVVPRGCLANASFARFSEWA